MNTNKATSWLGGISGLGMITDGLHGLEQGDLFGAIRILIGLALWAWGIYTNKP